MKYLVKVKFNYKWRFYIFRLALCSFLFVCETWENWCKCLKTRTFTVYSPDAFTMRKKAVKRVNEAKKRARSGLRSQSECPCFYWASRAKGRRRMVKMPVCEDVRPFHVFRSRQRAANRREQSRRDRIHSRIRTTRRSSRHNRRNGHVESENRVDTRSTSQKLNSGQIPEVGVSRL